MPTRSEVWPNTDCPPNLQEGGVLDSLNVQCLIFGKLSDQFVIPCVTSLAKLFGLIWFGNCPNNHTLRIAVGGGMGKKY